MADEKKGQSIIEEAGLPDNWEVVPSIPVIPGQSPVGAPPPSNPMPYFRGTLAPGLQHDSVFVGTEVGTPRIPSTPLMPMAPSGNAQVNAAVQSVFGSSAVVPGSTTAGMVFKGTWLVFAGYKIGDVVIFNLSAYVAIQGSVGAQPDLAANTTIWTLLSENLVFNASTANPGHTGFGTLDSVNINSGQNIFPATSAPTVTASPGESSGFALVASSVSEGVGGLAGYSDMGTAIGITNEGLYVKPFTTNAAITYTGTPIVRWCADLIFFSGLGESLTGSATSVQVASNVVTVACVQSFTVGTRVKFSGFSTETYLNNQTIIITSRTATSITGAFAHADTGPTADTGTATNIPYLQATAIGYTTGTNTVTGSFANPRTAGSTILVLQASNDVNSTFTMLTVSDGSATYGITNNPNPGAGSVVDVAIAQNVLAGNPTISVHYTSNHDSGNSVLYIIELPGGGASASSSYLPYDVKQFRGSMFVCNTETNLDAFDDPTSWWLLAQGTGYVDSLSGTFNPTILDYGRLISNSTASSYTVNLPAIPPSNSWWIALEQSGTGTIVINPNGKTLDGSSATFTLTQNQGLLIFTDGTNYLTVRGVVPIGGTWNTTAQSTTYSAVAGDYILATTGSGFTITLPLASANKNRAIRVKKVSADANVLTIARSGGDTIDGATSQTITIQYNEMEFVSDGTNWWIS